MPKRLIKDVAGILGIPKSEAEKITNLFPRTPFNITLAQVIDAEPKLKELELDPRYTELFALARKLDGLNRISSTHAAGLVISRYDLHNIIPLFKTSKGTITIQYDMNHIEKCGLVGFDFLGLKTLDIIKYTEEKIRRKGGEYAHFSIEKIPEDDAATFALFREGNTNHVFLFESNGIKNILRQVKPQTMTDLIALNALYRPGSLENIPRFIDAKNGNKNIDYIDPCLEDILKETYGVIVYQEQVIRIIQRIAGYSLGKADVLRRILGKKNQGITEKEKITFLDSAVKQGFSTEKAGAIFNMLIPFAGYSFSKSHSASYTKVAYQTAYLKANFSKEFMISV
jgi:DNA polymerase-3 subunit alpha